MKFLKFILAILKIPGIVSTRDGLIHGLIILSGVLLCVGGFTLLLGAPNLLCLFSGFATGIGGVFLAGAGYGLWLTQTEPQPLKEEPKTDEDA